MLCNQGKKGGKEEAIVAILGTVEHKGILNNNRSKKPVEMQPAWNARLMPWEWERDALHLLSRKSEVHAVKIMSHFLVWVLLTNGYKKLERLKFLFSMLLQNSSKHG